MKYTRILKQKDEEYSCSMVDASHTSIKKKKLEVTKEYCWNIYIPVLYFLIIV